MLLWKSPSNKSLFQMLWSQDQACFPQKQRSGTGVYLGRGLSEHLYWMWGALQWRQEGQYSMHWKQVPAQAAGTQGHWKPQNWPTTRCRSSGICPPIPVSDSRGGCSLNWSLSRLYYCTCQHSEARFFTGCSQLYCPALKGFEVISSITRSAQAGRIHSCRGCCYLMLWAG